MDIEEVAQRLTRNSQHSRCAVCHCTPNYKYPCEHCPKWFCLVCAQRDFPDLKWPPHRRPAHKRPAFSGAACRLNDGSSHSARLSRHPNYQYTAQQGPYICCQEWQLPQTANQHNQAVQLKAAVVWMASTTSIAPRVRRHPGRGTRPKRPKQEPQYTTKHLQQLANAHAAAQQRQSGQARQ